VFHKTLVIKWLYFSSSFLMAF